ncbi:hypothetical protein FI667_g2084, partial [Globisporangium splendens]
MQARHEDVVAAFYARVMQRVCAAYRDLDPKDNARIAELVAQRWSHRVTSYTGIAFPDTLSNAMDIDIGAPLMRDFCSVTAYSGSTATTGGGGGVEDDNTVAIDVAPAATVEAAHASEHAVLDDTVEEDMPKTLPPPPLIAGVGDPAAQIMAPSPQPRSIFAKMMGAKRKIAQMDGAIDGESDGDNGDGAASADHTIDNDAAPPTPPRDFGPLTTPASDVVAVLVPAWSLPVTGFPTQLSARFSKFALRSRQRDFYGKLSAIILTLTRPIVATDAILPGHVLWMYGAHQSSSNTNLKDGMVQVVSQQSRARSDEIHVMLADGEIVVVPTSCTRRFYEVLVAKGTVRFNLSHQH